MISPKAFVSYSWESETHKLWVQELAVRLRLDGVEVLLDQWELAPGDQLALFMERAVRESDAVLVVCTPAYKAKSDRRSGGVGYEGDVMTAEVANGASRRKFVPLLKGASWQESAPSWLLGSYYLDFRDCSLLGSAYNELLETLLQRRKKAPPVGKLLSDPLARVAGSVKVNEKDGLEYSWIPPGMFIMGPVEQSRYWDGNDWWHPVRITHGFWLTKTLVTVRAYKRFTKATGLEMPVSPTFNTDWAHEDHPIVNINWLEASEYCIWTGGRLPTEAEFEYAARGGKAGLKYPWGNSFDAAHVNISGETIPATALPQNGWGLHDMAGNRWQWVSDWFDLNYSTYPRDLDQPVEDPVGPDQRSKGGYGRAVRGGWGGGGPGNESDLLTSNRNWNNPEYRSDAYSFRCACQSLP
jgi:formylglycine-generating enzyme required for sulfatase activity